jgi:hypothetical protein
MTCSKCSCQRTVKGENNGGRCLGRLLLVLLFAALLLCPTRSAGAQATAVCDCPTCGTPRVYTSEPGFRLMCSATWQMTSTCGGPGVDQVDKWALVGAIPQSDWNIKPWSVGPVTLVGVELTKILGPPHVWWMVGNGSVPDAMVFMSRLEDHVKQFFPAGLGMPFPAIGNGMPNDYIDLHGVCASAGEKVQFFLTLFYVP